VRFIHGQVPFLLGVLIVQHCVELETCQLVYWGRSGETDSTSPRPVTPVKKEF
jgi:hypothetical protein